MTDLTILYYTDNHLPLRFAGAVRAHLWQIATSLAVPIVSISQRPIDFGRNICVGQIGRSFRSILAQIVTGCVATETEFVALAEHDVLYTPEHFALRPSGVACVVFDQNRHRMLMDTGTCVADVGGRSMQLVIAERRALLWDLVGKLNHAEKEADFHGAFEPGKRGAMDIPTVPYEMRAAGGAGLVEICNHGTNYTKRHPPHGETTELPGWGTVTDIRERFFIRGR